MSPSICNLDLTYLVVDCEEKIFCNCCTDCCDEGLCDLTLAPTMALKLPFGTDLPTSSQTVSVWDDDSTDSPTGSDLGFPTATANPTSTALVSSPPTATATPTVFVIPPTASLPPVTLSPANIVTITNKIASVSDISDTDSSQYKALQWVLNNDTIYSSDLEVYQRYALMTLYYSTDGDSWKDNTKWGKSITECYWYGVECAEENVVKLNLRKCCIILF